MLNPSPQKIHLKDYRPPAFLVDTIDLQVDIHDDATLVEASLAVRRNPASPTPDAPLQLDGEELQTVAVTLDGKPLGSADYHEETGTLSIAGVPDRFTLVTRVRIQPDNNTRLMGLYASRTGYFTQCEAEGFRRITWFPDRPDILSRYTTTIRADKGRFPLLLSNGNLDASGDLDGGRHFARWVDPHPKPSYLFALVAAELDCLADDFTTASGRAVKLLVYVEPGKLDQCAFAMESLKHAMRWDEQVFGLELDLDRYMIVAVSDFNMGAMENKGLNIFNTKYVLARPDTATDHDFQMLDRVVAHEYFHNWTGNRVTCRDWFQLSLKEGLTVFRDQQYGGDRYSHATQRIQEVRLLRAAQFPEDAGPMAHPVRPEAYAEINNFYTATVYNKGAEVVRMIHTLIGPERFRAGMDLYFQRHDGQAVTIEDFAAAMSDAGAIDLGQFRRWYSQAGTPVVQAEGHYDPAQGSYTLTLRQGCPATPGQADKQPFHIPVAVGLVGPQGEDLPLQLDDETQPGPGTRVLSLTAPEQHFRFVNLPAEPVPSLLRGFSAPVNLRAGLTPSALAHLMAHDSDPFNRWEAGQQLSLGVILDGIAAVQDGREPAFPAMLTDAFARLLDDAGADPAFAAEALGLPSATYIAEQMETVDPDALLTVRTALRRHLAGALQPRWEAALARYASDGPYSPEPAAAARRALANTALGYLVELETKAILTDCLQRLRNADNMTDAMAALTALANCACAEREAALEEFYQRWQGEPLVLDKWFAVQATSRLPDTLARVQALMQHPAWEPGNPNRVRALVGSFCHGNHARFNAADGSGYAFCADQVIALDARNPQVAARLARAFDRWQRFDPARRQHARAALERISATAGLSGDTAEVVGNALA